MLGRLRTFDTVPVDTPAILATSRMVTGTHARASFDGEVPRFFGVMEVSVSHLTAGHARNESVTSLQPRCAPRWLPSTGGGEMKRSTKIVAVVLDTFQSLDIRFADFDH